MIWLALACVVVVASAPVVYIAPPTLVERLARRRLARLARESGKVYLTFDDGPSAATPGVLSALRRWDTKATFFVLGSAARERPELLTQMAEEGHEIGLHGDGHRHAWFTGPWASARDLKDAAGQVARGGPAEGARLYRPPFGKVNLVTLLCALWSGLRLAGWTVDPRDYEQTEPEEVAAETLRQLRAGAVVLLHDGRAAGGSDAAVTVRALELILEGAAGLGLRFGVLSEALVSASKHGAAEACP